MALTIWVKLQIDRINISVGIGSSDLYNFVIAQLYGMKDLQKELVPNGKITIKVGHYRTRLNYYAKKLRIAEIEIGMTKLKHRYFKLGLSPSKFGPGDFDKFKETLSILLPDFCYAKLFETGRVSYIELAADSMSHKAHSFIPFRRRCNVSSVYIDKMNNAGSTYVGSH